MGKHVKYLHVLDVTLGKGSQPALCGYVDPAWAWGRQHTLDDQVCPDCSIQAKRMSMAPGPGKHRREHVKSTWVPGVAWRY